MAECAGLMGSRRHHHNYRHWEEPPSNNAWPAGDAWPAWSNDSRDDGFWPALPVISGHDTNKLYVKNTPQKVSRLDVLRTFKKFGDVKDVLLIRNKEDGRLRGFCFVTFREEAAALRALEATRSGSVRVGPCIVSAEPALPRRPRLSILWTPLAPPVPVALRRRPRFAAARSTGACHVDRLPTELLERILSLLPLRHQMAVQAVSCRWQAVVRGLLGRRREILLGRDYADPSEQAELDSEQLRQMLQLTTRLRRLHTGPSYLCPFETMDHITAHCPNMVFLDMLSASFTLNYQKLRRLVRSCPRLEDIILPSFYVYDEATVLLLLRHLPHLHRLELSRGTRLTGQSLALLPASMRRLRLPSCAWLESAHVRHVARCCQLRELDLSGGTRLQTEDLAAALAGCPRLLWLAAAKLNAPPELYLPQTGLVQLAYLDVEEAPGVTDATLRRLPDLAPALTTLNIQGCDGVTEAGLCQLGRLSQLQSLDMAYLRGVSDHVLQLLHGLPLRELRIAQGHMGRARFSIDGVVSLAVSCPSLTLLDLSCVEHLSEELLEQLERRLPDTRTLSVYVGATPLEKWPSPVADHLRLLQFITVPGGRREMTPALIWNEDEEEEVPTIADWRHPPQH